MNNQNKNKNNTMVSAQYLYGLFALLLVVIGQGATAAARLTGIEFSSLPGDRTEIRMAFDGTPPDPQGYTIDQPARIVLDMPGVVSALAEKHHDLGSGNARKVSVLSTKDRTRAIVNLTRLVAYDTEVRGNTLYLLVGGDGSGVPTPSKATDASQYTSAGPIVGFAEGRVPEVKAGLLLVKNISLIGLQVSDYRERAVAKVNEAQAHLCAMFGEGSLKPQIMAEVPLHEFPRAFAAVRDRQVLGKVVLDMGAPGAS